MSNDLSLTEKEVEVLIQVVDSVQVQVSKAQEWLSLRNKLVAGLEAMRLANNPVPHSHEKFDN